jgi:hypothetical protein
MSRDPSGDKHGPLPRRAGSASLHKPLRTRPQCLVAYWTAPCMGIKSLPSAALASRHAEDLGLEWHPVPGLRLFRLKPIIANTPCRWRSLTSTHPRTLRSKMTTVVTLGIDHVGSYRAVAGFIPWPSS